MNGPIQRKSQIVPVIIAKIKELELPSIHQQMQQKGLINNVSDINHIRKESAFELDPTRGISAFEASNNMETQTNFNIVDYEDQSEIDPPKLSITQSFHNAHHIGREKTAEQSDSSITGMKVSGKKLRARHNYMNQTQKC